MFEEFEEFEEFEVYGECFVFRIEGSILYSIGITALGEQPYIVEDMSALTKTKDLLFY